MKINTRHLSQPLQVLGAALSLASAPALSLAQQPQAPAPLLDEDSIRREKSLAAAVSFEVRRQKLPDVLAVMQAQSGVALSIAPGSGFEAKLLTARADRMPLAKVLASLSRLYAASWSKQGRKFEMTGSARSDFEQVLWKLNSTSLNSFYAAQVSPIDWSQEVARVGAARLRQPKGVAFSDLSPAIAQRLRSRIEDDYVTELGARLANLRVANLEGSTFQFDDIVHPGPGQPQGIELRLFLPSGDFISDTSLPLEPQDKPAAK